MAEEGPKGWKPGVQIHPWLGTHLASLSHSEKSCQMAQREAILVCPLGAFAVQPQRQTKASEFYTVRVYN